MDVRDALSLLETAIPRGAGVWADLGAGTGGFTRALVQILGPEGTVFAVDRDRRALAALERWASREAPNVTAVAADFSQPLSLPGIEGPVLDGMLCANALHFVRDAGGVLGRLVRALRPGGRFVLVEYDRRHANPWVPHPIPIAQLDSLAASAGLSTPVVTATRPSVYGGALYVATAIRRREGGDAAPMNEGGP